MNLNVVFKLLIISTYNLKQMVKATLVEGTETNLLVRDSLRNHQLKYLVYHNTLLIDFNHKGIYSKDQKITMKTTNKRGLRCAKLSPPTTSFLAQMELFYWLVWIVEWLNGWSVELLKGWGVELLDCWIF